jgi:hypothetical protein
MFATAINGKQPSTPKLQLSIQKQRSQSRLARRKRLKKTAQAGAPTASSDSMLAVEQTLWEAWRAHDGKKLADLTAENISFINIFGTYLATKADALKDWTSAGCDVKRVRVTQAARTTLSPTSGVLTFKATADGICYGQEVNSYLGHVGLR